MALLDNFDNTTEQNDRDLNWDQIMSVVTQANLSQWQAVPRHSNYARQPYGHS
jgi:hypothetical protein